MLTIDALLSRISTAAQSLTEPGPSDAQLERMLAAAMHVPDHGRLAPWRFIVIRDAARQPLAEFLAQRSRELDPAAPEAVVTKTSSRFSQSPCIIATIAQLHPAHKIPESEQWLSGGAVCLSLLQAAHALGFGAQWLTGWAAYDSQVMTRLGLADNERILGFIHIGSSGSPPLERPRPSLDGRLQFWRP